MGGEVGEKMVEFGCSVDVDQDEGLWCLRVVGGLWEGCGRCFEGCGRW